MARELYLVGDGSRLLVKNLQGELKEAGFTVQVVAPIPERLEKLPADKPIHVMLILSEGLDFQAVRTVAKLREATGLHIYTVGSLGNIDIGDKAFFDRLPSTRFSSVASLDAATLLHFVDRNDAERKRLLVVDDEPLLLRSIKGWLGDEFDVSLVTSGEVALEFLVENPVDLVLLDYKMPKMDGPDTLMKIRLNETIKNTPVIMLTAANDRESVMRAMKMKPDGYLLKTKSPEEIKESVRDFFKNRIVHI